MTRWDVGKLAVNLLTDHGPSNLCSMRANDDGDVAKSGANVSDSRMLGGRAVLVLSLAGWSSF